MTFQLNCVLCPKKKDHDFDLITSSWSGTADPGVLYETKQNKVTDLVNLQLMEELPIPPVLAFAT